LPNACEVLIPIARAQARKHRGYTRAVRALDGHLGPSGIGVAGIISMERVDERSNQHAKNLAIATQTTIARFGGLDLLAAGHANSWNPQCPGFPE